MIELAWVFTMLACITFLWWGSYTNWCEAREIERDRDEWKALALRTLEIEKQMNEDGPYTGKTQPLCEVRP